jgi:hypothetical protein
MHRAHYYQISEMTVLMGVSRDPVVCQEISLNNFAKACQAFFRPR